MTYEETLHYLYTSIPVFQHSGASAYKPGLGTSIALDDYLGNPHKAYKTIHVAGTNGKGSVSHLLAAILRQSGFKVGLYTSPHLVDFRERIRVNGKKISQELRMIQTDIRDNTQDRSDNVRTVQTTAKPDLDNRVIYLLVAEILKSHAGR